jgi:EmrB/QacA subfamily drug resistance transporter
VFAYALWPFYFFDFLNRGPHNRAVGPTESPEGPSAPVATLDPSSAPDRAHRHRWSVEPPRPDWLRERPNAHYFALATVCVGAFMGQLDASIVTVAFPTLQRVFHASVESVTWVGLSYLIVLIAGVIAVGRLSDMVGRKLLYTYGFIVFIVGSGLCAVAPSLLSLDAFRVIQAVGAVLLQANSVAIIYLAMPRRHLGRGIGIQGAAQALGLALGPTVGGLLLAAGGWRLIFLVNVPAGVLGTLAAWVFLPRSRDLQERAPFDWAGLGLLVPAIVALLVAVSFGGRWGWVSPVTLGLLAAAGLSGAAFVIWEGRARAPMLDLSLFRRIPFSAGLASGMLSYLVLFGTMFAVPFFLERARGSDPGRAGLVLSVLPLALGCVAPISGRLVDRIGARSLTVSGMAMAAAGLAVAGVTRPSLVLLGAELGFVGAGLGMFTAANNSAIMGAAPRSQAAVASGVLNMTRGLGTAFGLALTGLVFGSAAARSSAVVAAGFERAALFLAAVAAVSALLAAVRAGTGPRRRAEPVRGAPGESGD